MAITTTYLTLTSVVFESVYEKIFSEFCLYLTLTSVVFELKIDLCNTS